jgi:hypothetical protein
LYKSPKKTHGMAFTEEMWAEYAKFPVCPVQALEEALVEKEIQKEDLDNIDKRIEDLKTYEQNLRELGQEIERKVRLVKMNLYTDSSMT